MTFIVTLTMTLTGMKFMSEYISIRDDLYKKLDNMRVEKDKDKKTSFSDSLDMLFETIREKDRIIEEKEKQIKILNIDM